MKNEAIFRSANEEHDIYYYIFPVEDIQKEVKGVVQISHGMKEYFLRYKPFIDFLNKEGFIVAGHDHAGHGKSIDQTYGYMGAPNAISYLVKDLKTVNDIVIHQYPDLPLYLLGHSMGSFIARVYTEAYPNSMDGLILSGTGGPQFGASMLKRLMFLLMKIKGEKTDAIWMDKQMSKTFNKKISTPHYAAEWISTDLDVVKAYEKDPLCSFPFTYGGYYTLFSLRMAANKKEWFTRFPKELPVLLASGLLDPVGEYGVGVMEVYLSLLRGGAENVSIRLYDDMRHEILNEKEKDLVYHDMVRWILTGEVDFN